MTPTELDYYSVLFCCISPVSLLVLTHSSETRSSANAEEPREHTVS